MALFLDSVEPDRIAKAMELGIYAGVTTNPRLLAAARREDPYELLARVARACPGSLYLQVPVGPLEEMEDEALTLREVAPGRAVIKIPACAEGLILCRRLRNQDLPVCITAAFTPLQAFAAGAAGAHAVALYVGRIERGGGDGVEAVAQSARALAAAGHATRVLAASIPDVQTLQSLIGIAGIDLTLPWDLHEALLAHPGTEQAIADFAAAQAELDAR